MGSGHREGARRITDGAGAVRRPVAPVDGRDVIVRRLFAARVAEGRDLAGEAHPGGCRNVLAGHGDRVDLGNGGVERVARRRSAGVGDVDRARVIAMLRVGVGSRDLETSLGGADGPGTGRSVTPGDGGRVIADRPRRVVVSEAAHDGGEARALVCSQGNRALDGAEERGVGNRLGERR